MMSEQQTAQQLISQLNNQELSSRELVQQCLDRITSVDDSVKAFLEVNSESALQQADAIDQKRSAGESVGPLTGIPIAIKDNICVEGWKTSCSSKMLENFTSVYDAHVIENLKSAGAVLIGRVNLDEFAMGSSCENSAFQKTANPWNTDCAPGGSSGGSAAAVAAGMVPLSIGSDTGGSIRQPAAFCGVVGMKPTYGRVSRYGLVAFASSLDQIGPFAKNVSDAALLLESLWGHDRRDSTSVDIPAPSLVNQIDQPLAGLKVGIVSEHYSDGLDDEVHQAIQSAKETYQAQGAEIHEVELPHAKCGVAAYYIIAPSEASSNLSRYDGIHYGHRASSEEKMSLEDLYERSRGEGFGPEVKRRIMLGAYALSSGYYDAYYLKALKVRRLIAEDYQKAFEKVDVILSPTSPSPAFKLGELVDDPLQMYLNDIYTIGANLAGIPGISIPAGLSSQGLPIGIQLLAPVYEEEKLLRAARMYEKEHEHSLAVPSL
ncbi:MAG: Asp-tRNA(Asn)/Glu-tRNA(Gln) amidotransferase subunit GatA [Planctomicrobium sp.]|jgi:aspartyl-tRNA(Asn)/glutamyl-tRNA(Gln) amidotransferase subunit A|nr:Asp-tRNA(Asn)/Glu-tRNA(Gln) amidotransferase subunit GatA [Planctomicrobium sp.]